MDINSLVSSNSTRLPSSAVPITTGPDSSPIEATVSAINSIPATVAVPRRINTASSSTSATATVTSTSAATAPRRLIRSWSTDDVDGGPSSNTLLITWIREERNYSRLRGGDSQNGESKEVVCNEIVNIFKANKIYHRTSRDVRTRIQQLQSSFRKAIDWREQTGQGIMNKMNGEGAPQDSIDNTINGSLKKICPFFFELEEVMGSRPNIRPLHPNSSEESANAMEAFFSEGENESEDDEVQATSVSRRPLSVANRNSAPERPSKRMRKTLEDSLAEALSKQEESNSKRYILDEKRVEIEEKRVEAEIRRADEMLSLEKERVKTERAKAQIAMVEMWRSIGFSKDEIVEKLDAFWK